MRQRFHGPRRLKTVGAYAVAIGLLLGMCIAIDPAYAQYGYGAYGGTVSLPSRESIEAGMRLGRVFLIVVATVLGFCLGWVASPGAARFRAAALLAVLAVLAVLVSFTLTNNSLLGWGAALVLAVIGFASGLGYWLGSNARKLMSPPSTFGSSRWATEADMRAHNVLSTPDNAGQSALWLGYVEREVKPGASKAAARSNGAPRRVKADIGYRGDRHCLTVAPTRAGKGATQIIPNLLTYGGSMLVIDPKGENAMMSAKARRSLGQTVHVLDPWQIAGSAYGPGGKAARFNPLDWLVPGDVDMAENAMLLADALVMQEGNGGSDRFWLEEAKAMLQGLILFVATDEEEAGQRHLGRVRDLLLLDGEDLPYLFQKMAGSFHHVVASTGARCLQKDPKLLSNVMASAQAETHFLDSARVRESLSVSDFTFDEVKRGKVTVYLVLPADRLHGFARWLRLIIQQALTTMARDIATKPEQPVLFLLDEMATLGRLPVLEQAYGLMAGFGMQLWGIIQDFAQLKRLYGDGWESFISNSGMIQYFGSRDVMTSEYFSSLCGMTTVWNLSTALSHAVSSSTQGGGSSSSYSSTRSLTQRKLAFADELMRLPPMTQLVFIDNMHPLIARRRPWFDDEILAARGVNLQDQSRQLRKSQAAALDWHDAK